MYAVTVLVVKRPDVSTEPFRSWWLGEHLPYSVKLLGAVDHIVLPLDETLPRRTSTWSDALPYDGIAVFLFADRDAARSAMDYPKTPEHASSVDAWIADVVVLGGAATLALSSPSAS